MIGCKAAATSNTPALNVGSTAEAAPASGARPASAEGIGGDASSEDPGREIGLLEKLHRSREEYRRTLEELSAYYNATGNGLQSQRAKEELIDVRNVRKYSYTVEPELTRRYRPGEQIGAADSLYWSAHKMFSIRNGREEDRERLKRCIRILQEMLAKYSTSDKCDEALVLLGRIHEHTAFTDYALAARYYAKAFEADPNTETDAYIRAAVMFETKLRNGARAAEIYALAAERDANPENRKFAVAKVRELTGK
jgi:tetratricopeptide (TPR) repeat protein